MDETNVRTCCLCGQRFIGWGNDPWPVLPEIELKDDEDAVCCDECNFTRVIPARLDLMKEERDEGERQ